MGVSLNKGYLFGVPYSKDYSILGSILGSSYLGKLPYNTPHSYHLPKARPKWGFPEIRGYPFWGPYNKDNSILGSILGSPYFGKIPNRLLIWGLFG